VTTSPLVSIVIPTYNGGELLVEALKSALAQDYANTEIIVVDDGSSRNTMNLLQPFADRITVVTQENKGPGAARNRGVMESTGEYITFLDHDDLWAANKVSVQTAILNENPDYGLVYGYPQVIDGDGNALRTSRPSQFPEGDVFEDFLLRNRITTFSATMIRRAAFLAVGGIDESLEIVTCDDYDLWLRLAARYRVAFSPGDLVCYRKHAGNLVKNRLLNLDAHIRVMEKCRRFIHSEMPATRRRELDKVINKNLHRIHRMFGIDFYYDFPAGNLLARQVLARVRRLSPGDIVSLAYYLFTFPPFFQLRQFKRWLLGAGATASAPSSRDDVRDLPRRIDERIRLAAVHEALPGHMQSVGEENEPGLAGGWLPAPTLDLRPTADPATDALQLIAEIRAWDRRTKDGRKIWS